LLDLVGDGYAIHEAEMVFKDNCIHGPRHEEPQTIGTVGRGCQLVSVFLQQTQLRWIPVYAEQGAIGSHAVYVYRQVSGNSVQNCSTHNCPINEPVETNPLKPPQCSHGPPGILLVNFDQSASPPSLHTDER
jgi:hypothetical protein